MVQYRKRESNLVPCKRLTAELKTEMNNQDKIERKAQKSRKLVHVKEYKKRRNIVIIKCNNKIRKAKANYCRERIDQNLSNPRKFWNAIKIIF